jgi:hypothetical protein
LDDDDIDRFDAIEHRRTSTIDSCHSITKAPDNFKSSLEGLSEREVRILVQDEFTPMVHQKCAESRGFHFESNIQSGAGLPNTTAIINDDHLQVPHNGIISSSLEHPMEHAMSSDEANQKIRQKKMTAANEDLFLTGE